MKDRSRWISAFVSAGVVSSLALFSFGAKPTNAAPPKHSVSSHVAKSKCTKINKPTGSIRFSDWQFPDTLNIYQSALNVDLEITDEIEELLFYYNGSGKEFPWVAAKMPTIKDKLISKNGLTITVPLKHDVYFSNGQNLTSKDVKFSWEIASQKSTGPYCNGTCDNIVRMDTPNKYTIVAHYKQIYAAAITNGFQFPLMPTKWASDWNNDPAAAAAALEKPTYNFENTSYPTNGPYQVVQYVQNDRIVLQPNKFYRNMACGASISQPLFTFYASKPGLIAAAAAKQTDLTTNYTPADIKTLLGHANAYKTHNDPGFEWEHFELNTDATYQGKPNPVHDPNFRLALALALDKLGLIQSALGIPAAQAKTIEAWSVFTVSKALNQPFGDKTLTGQWDPIAKKYQSVTGRGQALADAKKLIAKTSCASGCTIDFDTTSGNPVRQAQEAVAAASFQKIGVTLNPNYIPASKFFSNVWTENGTLDHGDFQIGQFTNGVGIDPDGYRQVLDPNFCDRRATTHSAINANDACETDPRIHAAFDKGASSFSPKVRAAAYKFIQDEFNHQAYWIPLYYRGSLDTEDGANSAFHTNPYSTRYTWNMYSWKGKK